MIYSGNRRMLAVGLTFGLLAVPGATLAQTTDSVRSHIHSKSGLVSGLAARLEASEKQLIALQADLLAKEQALATLEASLQREQQQQRQVAALDAEKDKRLTAAEARVEALNSSVVEREDALAVISEKEQALAALQAQFNAQKSLLDGLNSRLQEQDGLIVELQSQLGGGQTNPDSEDGTVKDLQQSASSDSDLKADLDAAIYTVRERDAEIGRLKADLQKIKSVNLENQKSIESLEWYRLLLGGGLGLALIGLLMSFRRRR